MHVAMLIGALTKGGRAGTGESGCRSDRKGP